MNLYYTNAVDNNWDTLLNWFTDATHLVQAASIPANGDTVYIDGQLDSGPNTADVTLANIYVGASDIGGSSLSFGATFTGTHQAIGDVTTYSATTISGAIIGSWNSYDISYNGGSVSCTTWNSYDSSNNYGYITCTTWNSHDSSYNYSTVSCTTWNSHDYSYNGGIVSCTTWNSYDSSYNGGYITCTTWNSHDYSSNNYGYITCTTWNSHDYSSNNYGYITCTTWNSHDSSYNSDYSTISCTTWNSYDSSYNGGYNGGHSTISCTTWNIHSLVSLKVNVSLMSDCNNSITNSYTNLNLPFADILGTGLL